MDSNRFYISPLTLDKLLAGPDPEDADQFVRAYLKDKRLFRDNVEPVDILARLEVFMARACCGRRGERPLPIRQEDICKVGLLKWIEVAAVELQALNPISTVAFWRRAIAGILRGTYRKGIRITPKKRPALAIRAAAARGLSFKQLEAMFPNQGRSILRRYHKEANDAHKKK